MSGIIGVERGEIRLACTSRSGCALILCAERRDGPKTAHRGGRACRRDSGNRLSCTTVMVSAPHCRKSGGDCCAGWLYSPIFSRLPPRILKIIGVPRQAQAGVSVKQLCRLWKRHPPWLSCPDGFNDRSESDSRGKRIFYAVSNGHEHGARCYPMG
jgi:hypothetical protein